MSRATRLLGASLLVLSICPAVQANWFTDWWAGMQRDAAKNRDWPMHFSDGDRAAVEAPFQQMAVNGWRRQNLLGAHHFTPDGAQLTQAGERKVHWILTQTPPQQRTIFIERTLDPTLNARRIDAVQQLAVRSMPTGELPAVQETHIVTEGRPAATVDRTNTQFQESMPKPQLAPARFGLDE